MNTKNRLHKFLMSLPETVLDFPFGEGIYVYRVADKIFAIYFKDENSEQINLKCEPERAQQLRSIFKEVTPGYHMNKRHWNTINLKGELPVSEIFSQIDHSYDLVASKLPKATKQRLRISYERLAFLK
jgi:predicted DNA-binding protein (MmcQ/YjbR family)